MDSSPLPSASVRVLIADDEAPLREAICALIDDDPSCDVVGLAANADEALAMAHEHRPDVALVDVKMPFGGGIRVAQELTLHGAPTRVVALSAYADRSTVAQLLRAGAVGYLVKGASSAEIIEALHRAKRGQASISAEMLMGAVDSLTGALAEQRAAQQVQRHDDERTRGLLELAPDAVVVVDEAGEIVLVNRQTERMFGYDRGELLGRAVEMLLPERFVGRHVEHRSTYRRDPRTREMGIGLELAGRRRDGSEFPVDISLSSVEAEGGLLVTAFIRDATDRKLQEKLRREDLERRMLVGRLVAAAEEERQRIAGDIHDDSIQAMAAASIRLQLLRRRLSGDELELLDNLGQTVDNAIERLRHLLFELRPPALDREGIGAALRLYIQQSGGDVDFRLDERISGEPSPETRVILYRLAQEALTNVRKHARASSASVLLDERDGGYRLRVTDDGVGFKVEDANPVPGHLGLAAMRERAELAGGWLRIESAVDAGTTVEFWLPPQEPAGAVV